MRKITKAKRSGGEILGINEIFDKGPTKVKNYAIWLRYESRTNTHNMYKEFRDVNINGAIIPASACRRDHVKEMHKSDLKFPIIRKMPLISKKLRSTFVAGRPQTFVR